MIELTHLPLPTPYRSAATGWRSPEDIAAARDGLARRTYWLDGALIWNSNDRPVPPHVFEEAFVEAPAAQQAAYDAATQAALAEYRRSRTGKPLSAEERFEMRAAFGEGVAVVNAITGDRYTT